MRAEKHRKPPLTLIAILAMILVLTPMMAMGSVHRSKGQTVYLSVVPQIQAGPKLKTMYLRFWILVRNTDLNHAVTIRSVTYYNAGGQMEKKILEVPLQLKPLASHGIRFKENVLAIPEGMSGCMIVEWEASEKVSPALVEGVVIGSGTGWTTGLVFRGVVVQDKE
jgi:hypothetical protein